MQLHFFNVFMNIISWKIFASNFKYPKFFVKILFFECWRGPACSNFLGAQRQFTFGNVPARAFYVDRSTLRNGQTKKGSTNTTSTMFLVLRQMFGEKIQKRKILFKKLWFFFHFFTDFCRCFCFFSPFQTCSSKERNSTNIL